MLGGVATRSLRGTTSAVGGHSWPSGEPTARGHDGRDGVARRKSSHPQSAASAARAPIGAVRLARCFGSKPQRVRWWFIPRGRRGARMDTAARLARRPACARGAARRGGRPLRGARRRCGGEGARLREQRRVGAERGRRNTRRSALRAVRVRTPLANACGAAGRERRSLGTAARGARASAQPRRFGFLKQTP